MTIDLLLQKQTSPQHIIQQFDSIVLPKPFEHSKAAEPV
jgi:hypothetical protein